MKLTIIILGLFIGILLGLISYLSSKYLISHVKYVHIKTIENKANESIRYICFNNVGYLIVTTYGTAVTVAVDSTGKPLKCNF